MSTFSPESRATSSGVMDSRPLSKPLRGETVYWLSKEVWKGFLVLEL